MNTVAIFDTKYGNTWKKAEAIGRRLDRSVLQAAEVDPESLSDYDLLVLGFSHPRRLVHRGGQRSARVPKGL